MFAVFAEDFTGNEVNGRGVTPQDAWENMLTDFALEENDIDVDTVEFFRVIEVTRETRVTWAESADTDE